MVPHKGSTRVPPGKSPRPRPPQTLLGDLSELGWPQSDMLGSQDRGAPRRFIALSGEEPSDAGRQVSRIFPALGLVEGEARLKAVLLRELAGGRLGGHASAFSAAPWAPGSLTWRPVPPGLTRAGTRLLTPSSPRRAASPARQPGALFRSHAGRGRLTLALLRPAVAAGLARPRAVLSVGCAFLQNLPEPRVLLSSLPGPLERSAPQWGRP